MLRNKSGIYIYIYIIINNQDQIYFFKSISKICFFSNYSTPCRNHSYSILRNNRWLHWFEELLSGGKKKGRVPQITYQASLAGRTEPVFLNSAPAENRSNFKPTPLSRTWGHPPVNSSPRPPIDPSEVFDVHSVRGLSRGRRLMTPHTHTHNKCAGTGYRCQQYGAWSHINAAFKQAVWLAWCLKYVMVLFSRRCWQRPFVVESTLEISLLVLATGGTNNLPVKPVILNWGFPTQTWGCVFSVSHRAYAKPSFLEGSSWINSSFNVESCFNGLPFYWVKPDLFQRFVRSMVSTVHEGLCCLLQ